MVINDTTLIDQNHRGLCISRLSSVKNLQDGQKSKNSFSQSAHIETGFQVKLNAGHIRLGHQISNVSCDNSEKFHCHTWLQSLNLVKCSFGYD